MRLETACIGQIHIPKNVFLLVVYSSILVLLTTVIVISVPEHDLFWYKNITEHICGISNFRVVVLKLVVRLSIS